MGPVIVPEPSIVMLGDSAVLAVLGREISDEANKLVQQVCAILENLNVPGILEAQPAYSSFAVHFEPDEIDPDTVMTIVRDTLRGLGRPSAGPREGRLVEIPVVYGGDEGPDLAWAAERLGMSCEDIVRIHSSKDYRVHMLGFTPGFPYLAGLDERIALPRLDEPRQRVPAGSVGIAGKQTGVYPWESPGGWRIIGRTFEPLFAPFASDPSLIHPGDRVRFVPVAGSGGCEPSLPGLSVERAGFMTLVVDTGRVRHRKLGVPVSGAADLYSYRKANLICGNPPDDAALEITLFGPSLVALRNLTVAIAGAPVSISLDGQKVDTSGPFSLPPGSVLDVGSMESGCRAYLSVLGGIAVRKALGSSSTYLRGGFGGLDGRRLKTGDVLRVGSQMRRAGDCRANSKAYSTTDSEVYSEVYSGSGVVPLDLTPGPEATENGLEALYSGIYTVRPESDRMGIKFDGPTVMEGPGDILSSPVVPGTLQVPSDGKPLLLLADAQTTGGYRRLAVLTSASLGVAGQLRPGARVRFAPGLHRNH